MSTFVLVHGGWHGAWCWKRVAPILRAAGNEVVTPTLTGLGDRTHLRDLVGERIDLALHADDVVAVLEADDLRDVVLVGHSYGGMVITGVAHRLADRLAGVIYLDAFVPGDGQALFDVLPPARRAVIEAAAVDGWLVAAPAAATFGVVDPDDAAWVQARLVPQPLRTFTSSLRHLVDDLARRVPHAYVHCTEGPLAASFAPFAQRAGATPGWRTVELSAGHDAMITHPAAVASALVAT